MMKSRFSCAQRRHATTALADYCRETQIQASKCALHTTYKTRNSLSAWSNKVLGRLLLPPAAALTILLIAGSLALPLIRPASAGSPSLTTTVGDMSSTQGSNANYTSGEAITSGYTGTSATVGLDVQGVYGSGAHIRVALYSAFSGSQFSGLLCQSPSAAVVNGWNDLPCSTRLVAGAKYYILYESDASFSGGTGFIFYGTYVDNGSVYEQSVYAPYALFTDPTVTVTPVGGWINNMRIIMTGSTTTDVSCSPSSVIVRADSTCTATVLGTSPTGTVVWTSSSATGEFSSDGSCVLTSGSCSLNYLDSISGAPTITAIYSGDTSNSGSSGSFELAIVDRSTTSLTCAKPLRVGVATTCAAKVTDMSSGTPITPSGAVMFSSTGTGRFSSSTCNLSGSGATATCGVTFTPMRPGFDRIVASYEGDAAHAGSSGSHRFGVTR
jgi:hypothetical protein